MSYHRLYFGVIFGTQGMSHIGRIISYDMSHIIPARPVAGQVVHIATCAF